MLFYNRFPVYITARITTKLSTEIANKERIHFEIFSPQVDTKMSVSDRDPATNQLEEFRKKKGVS